MRLRHATLSRNLEPCQAQGLLASKSKGKLKAVWLHSASRSAWAAVHTVSRHGGRVERVVVIEVDLPRSWLTRWGNGLWYCTRDVPADRIVAVWGFGRIARSPVEEVV